MGISWLILSRGRFTGRNKFWGENIAVRFVPLGFGVVSANYRLSPGVMHPAHIEDATTAFAWVVKNIETFGGDPDQSIQEVGCPFRG